MQSSSYQSQQAFTLIEIMVVIVIMSVLASLVVFNIGGVDQRRAMQARDVFILDLQRINKEAIDQAKVLALVTDNATDVAPFGYHVVEYHDQHNQRIQQSKLIWEAYQEFQPRQLPKSVSFHIQDIVTDQYRYAQNNDLIGEQTPKLIWFGNGEVKPVRIQFYYGEQPIGHALVFDYLGNVHEEE